MGDSAIQWTDKTWNPITGCSKVSQGCKFCYAERIWKKVYGFRPFTDVKFHPDRLTHPIGWKKPCAIFVNSMSDMFHEDVKSEWIDSILAVAGLTPRHKYQVLTKRPQRMLEEMTRISKSISPVEGAARALGYSFKFDGLDGAVHSTLPWPIPNVWMGVSVEDQKTADERIDILRQTPAAIRWVSFEPLLGPIYLRDFRTLRVDWAVIGGESGTKEHARKFDLRWAYDIVAQCRAAKIPVFVKQMGRNPFFSGGGEFAGKHNLKFRDSHGGDMSEWPVDLQVREYPQ
jgi:protein gp37